MIYPDSDEQDRLRFVEAQRDLYDDFDDRLPEELSGIDFYHEVR